MKPCDDDLPPASPGRRRLLAAAALGSLTGAAGAAGDGPQPRPWPRGRATPPLALPGHDGPAWDLAQARGHVVLLNFWASWCEPCRAEMPSLELLAQRHEADGLVVVAVNFRETDAAIRRFMAQMPISLPILRDADGATSRAWGARIFPTTVAVDRAGRAAFSVVGECEWNGPQARAWIAPLLADRR
jgi:thiol-disulfide isomerase/thioredoxin